MGKWHFRKRRSSRPHMILRLPMCKWHSSVNRTDRFFWILHLRRCRHHHFHYTWRWCCCTMGIRPSHQVGRGERWATVNDCAQFLHRLHITWQCFDMWHKHSESNSWCRHLAPATPHVAVWNAADRSPIACLDNVSTGTGQCTCISQMVHQWLPGWYLLATSQWPINEWVSRDKPGIPLKQEADHDRSINGLFRNLRT